MTIRPILIWHVYMWYLLCYMFTLWPISQNTCTHIHDKPERGTNSFPFPPFSFIFVWLTLGHLRLCLRTCIDIPTALLHLRGGDRLRSETLAGFPASGRPRWQVTSSTPANAIRSCFCCWVWDRVRASIFSTGEEIDRKGKRMRQRSTSCSFYMCKTPSAQCT